VEGHIGFAETGMAGFGYDPLFIPVGYECSFGLFAPADKNAISHRGRALAALAERLSAEDGERASSSAE
jgi:XTP/dITP diphosphohydrolase